MYSQIARLSFRNASCTLLAIQRCFMPFLVSLSRSAYASARVRKYVFSYIIRPVWVVLGQPYSSHCSAFTAQFSVVNTGRFRAKVSGSSIKARSTPFFSSALIRAASCPISLSSGRNQRRIEHFTGFYIYGYKSVNISGTDTNTIPAVFFFVIDSYDMLYIVMLLYCFESHIPILLFV